MFRAISAFALLALLSCHRQPDRRLQVDDSTAQCDPQGQRVLEAGIEIALSGALHSSEGYDSSAVDTLVVLGTEALGDFATVVTAVSTTCLEATPHFNQVLVRWQTAGRLIPGSGFERDSQLFTDTVPIVKIRARWKLVEIKPLLGFIGPSAALNAVKPWGIPQSDSLAIDSLSRRYHL